MPLFCNHRRYMLITVLSFLALVALSIAIYKYDNYTHTSGKAIAFETQTNQNTPYYLVTVEYLDRQQQKHQTQLKMSAKPSVLVKFDLRYPEGLPQKASLYNASYLSFFGLPDASMSKIRALT